MSEIICKDVYGNEHKVKSKDLKLRVGVYAVIIENNKILLTRQWDGYSLIGGGLELGETIEDAIIREVKEETGLDFTPDRVVYYATTFFKRDEVHAPHQSVQLYFSHKDIVGELNNANITASEKTYTTGSPEWVDVGRIGEIKFRHSVKLEEILEAYRGCYGESNREKAGA